MAYTHIHRLEAGEELSLEGKGRAAVLGVIIALRAAIETGDNPFAIEHLAKLDDFAAFVDHMVGLAPFEDGIVSCKAAYARKSDGPMLRVDVVDSFDDNSALRLRYEASADRHLKSEPFLAKFTFPVSLCDDVHTRWREFDADRWNAEDMDPVLIQWIGFMDWFREVPQ